MNCYLKVNFDIDYTYIILTHWVEICRYLKDCRLYLLCDKDSIIDTIRTKHAQIFEKVEILKSIREEPEICGIADLVLSQYLRSVGLAHLTTFWHAKQTGCDAFWNIDADDLYLAAAPESVAALMEEIQMTARREGIHAFSLDMHVSRLRGMHWSFGLTYTDNTIDWFAIMCRYIQPYDRMRYALGGRANLDWFFTFMRKKASECRLESFYTDHLRFIHYCYDFIRHPDFGGIYFCESGRYITPVIRDLLDVKKLGDIPVYPDVIKIESGITKGESISWLQRYTAIYRNIKQDKEVLEEDLCMFVMPYLNDAFESEGLVHYRQLATELIEIRDKRLVLKDVADEPDVIYVLLPYGIGDSLYALGFMNEWRNTHAPGKRLRLILKDDQAPLSAWFAGDHEAVASTQLNVLLNQYMLTNGISRLENFFYAHFARDTSFRLLPEYENHPDKNMIARFRDLVFRLPPETVPVPPAIPEVAVEEIAGCGIDKKTVILVPYGTSSSELSPLFWITVAKSLQLLGCRVLTYTAVADRAVEGTEAFSADPGKLPRFMEAALAVIAVRNGLCDVLAQTDAIMFVINRSEELLKEWNLSYANPKAHIVNLLCESHNRIGETAKEVITFFSEAVLQAGD